MFGDPREVSEGLRLFREDQIFIDQNFEDLYGLYPEQFIAVKGKQVIVSTSTVEEFLDAISNNPEESKDFAWRHLEKNPRRLILIAA